MKSLIFQKKLNQLLESIDKEKKSLESKIPIVVKISPDIDDQEIKKITEVTDLERFLQK